MTPRDVVEFKEVDCQGAVLVMATTLPSVRIWWIREGLDQGAVDMIDRRRIGSGGCTGLKKCFTRGLC